MKKLASREYGFSVPFCYVTNHPKIEWLKPQTILLLLILWARTLGIGISGQFYMVSVGRVGWIRASLTYLGPRGWLLALCEAGQPGLSWLRVGTESKAEAQDRTELLVSSY